jgi:protein SCO1/2
MNRPSTGRASFSRRDLLGAAFGLTALSTSGRAGALEPPAILTGHRAPGRLPSPLPMPRLPVVLDNGQRSDLVTELNGKVTALQFVLVGCSSICPMLGAIFSRVEEQLPTQGDFALLSISLDPLGDTPASLTEWLTNFRTGKSWRGAIPDGDPAAITAMLKGWGLSSETESDFHTESVLLVDRAARLVYRFPDLPDPVEVASVMQLVP